MSLRVNAAIVSLSIVLLLTQFPLATWGGTLSDTGYRPMIGAVMEGDLDAVRRLAERHESLDERNPDDQSTPMVAAAQVDQWRMVEILIDHGADIWAHDQFGITAAQRTLTSRVLRGSPDDEARLRVIEKLKARGYPFPPPGRAEILALDKDGKWPPKKEDSHVR